MTKFQHGRRYRLVRSVRNARYDARFRDNAARADWCIGRMFYCIRGDNHTEFRIRRGDFREPINAEHPNYEEFTEALVELEESVEDALSSQPWSDPEVAIRVLKNLVATGKLTLQDIKVSVDSLA